MLPIFNSQGRVISFTARVFGNQKQFEGREQPKYINGPETEIYKKGSILYGLNFSRDSIIKTKQAIIVEGGFDILQLYQNGVTNIAAPCGTALTLHS